MIAALRKPLLLVPLVFAAVVLITLLWPLAFAFEASRNFKKKDSK